MSQTVLEKLAKVQNQYPWLVILLVLTVTLFLGYYGIRIQTDSSLDVIYADDSETLQLQNLMASEFGSTDSIFVLVQVDESSDSKDRIQDIRHPAVLKAVLDLTNSLETETVVDTAQSLPHIFLMVYGRLPTSLEESKQMINDLPQNVYDQYIPNVMNSDKSIINVFVAVNVERKPGSMEAVEDIVRKKVSETPLPIGIKASITGMPVMMNTIMGFLIGDNIKTIGYAIIGVFIVLWIYFKSYKIAFISTVPILFMLTWLTGALYLMDIRISIMIASVGAMLIGMSVDYSIHLTHTYHEKIKEGHKKPVAKTVKDVGAALFASATTTIAGFIAMLLGTSPNSIIQGKVLSIGIFFAFFITLVVLPPMMILQRRFVYSKIDEMVFRIRGRSSKTNKKSFINRFLATLAKFQSQKPGMVIFLVLGITLLIIPGFGLVYMDLDDENWIPQGDESMEAMEIMYQNFGGLESLNLLFILNEDDSLEESTISDLRDPQILKPMSQLDTALSGLGWVDSISAPSVSIKNQNNGFIPNDLHAVKDLFQNNPDLKGEYNKDYSIAKFTINGLEVGRDHYYEVLNEIDSMNFPKSVSIVPQGGAPEDIEMEQSMTQDTMKTTGLGFLFVIIIASLFYRSLTTGILAFIPIIFAIIWTIGAMGYINLPFSVLTTGMLALLMGMGIDFSIHLIHSIRLHLKETSSLESAISKSLLSTGSAISTATITTVVGFMALSFATLVNTKRLGWTLGLGIVATYFACMFIVPAVMALRHKIQMRKSAQIEEEN